MSKKIVVTIALVALLAAAQAFAAVPAKINFQGMLTDSSGTAISATKSMAFRMFSALSGGGALWEEMQSVAVASGVYNAQLGSVTAFPADLFDTGTLYLEVQVETEVLSPRQQVTSAAFAIKAGDATSLGGTSAADFVQAAQLAAGGSGITINWSNLVSVPSLYTQTEADAKFLVKTAGAVGSTNIADEAVTSAKILNGTITGADIALPLELFGSSVYAIVYGTNTGSGAGVHGANYSSGIGVYGVNYDIGTGVYGANDSSGIGVYGANYGTGIGVYGVSTSGYAGWFAGDAIITGTGKGLVFPDGTKQTTAVTGGGGGVPAGSFIMTDDQTPPTGYTYTGMQVVATGPGSWATKATMTTERTQFVAAAVNNKIYAIGGYNGSSLGTTEEYDPASDTWTTKAAMPTARNRLGAAVVNNKIYAIGGYNGSSILGTMEEYDPAGNTWTTKAAMPTARCMLAAAAVNNKIYAMGGGSTLVTSDKYLNTMEEYDPASDTWATKTAMPTARCFLCAAVVNNKIYAIGGEGLHIDFLGTTEEYDPAGNTWATKTAMPTARTQFAAAVVNNKIYAIGGWGGGHKLDTTEEYDQYDPLGNNWATKTAMPTARTQFAAAAVNNKIYAIGGSNGSYLGTTEAFKPGIYYMHVKN